MCKKRILCGKDYKDLLRIRKISQKEVAAEIGCSQPYLNYFINQTRDTFSQIYLQKLNEILGIK